MRYGKLARRSDANLRCAPQTAAIGRNLPVAVGGVEPVQRVSLLALILVVGSQHEQWSYLIFLIS
jgi:hypothetical protein